MVPEDGVGRGPPRCFDRGLAPEESAEGDGPDEEIAVRIPMSFMSSKISLMASAGSGSLLACGRRRGGQRMNEAGSICSHSEADLLRAVFLDRLQPAQSVLSSLHYHQLCVQQQQEAAFSKTLEQVTVYFLHRTKRQMGRVCAYLGRSHILWWSAQESPCSGFLPTDL
ncbi:hypothetical protein EYF80_021589 [Liparis tanakae]|uniref:Uncharacterized protein n=1 Tax=Liparis tanakae TaxID=230148 RepID=A0A4Z2HQI6_9TELE|nr:hypothetical protein EYF80_021589 [Liparis tanakae]